MVDGRSFIKIRKSKGPKLVNAHMNALLEMHDPTNSSSALQLFYDSVESHARSLASLGKSQETYGSLLLPIILNKLPADVGVNLARQHDSDEWTIEKRPRSKEGSNQCGKKSKRDTTCPVCDETIKEPTKHRKGDDSIYCEGYCDAWIHRRCTGLSAATLAVLGEAGEDQTFFCLYCELQAHKAEIENLMSTITELQTCLFDLKRKLDATQQLQQTSKSQTSVPSNTTAKETHEILNQSTNNAERNSMLYMAFLSALRKQIANSAQSKTWKM